MRLHVTVQNNDPKDWLSVGENYLLTSSHSYDLLIDELCKRVPQWIASVDQQSKHIPAAMILLRLHKTTDEQQYGSSYCISRVEWEELFSSHRAMFEIILNKLVRDIEEVEKQGHEK